MRVALSSFLADDAVPRAERDDVAPLPADFAALPTDPVLPSRIRGRVLLVEDNPVNRMVAQRLHDLLGLSCDAVEHGKLAIERLAAQRYDAVLLDCQMQIMDGYGATPLLPGAA